MTYGRYHIFSIRYKTRNGLKNLAFQLPISLGLDVFTIQLSFVTENIASRLDGFLVGFFFKALGNRRGCLGKLA